MKTKLISRRSFWLCFSLALGLFLFGAESLRKNPFSIDQAIISSYLIIPVLILLAHLIERNTSLVAYLISCIELTCLKFAATYIIATGFWIYAGDPPPLPEIKYPPPKPKVASPPSVIPKDKVGVIEGQVLGKDGRAIAGALVFISKGLEDYVFATPTSTAVISHDGHSFYPALTILQTHQSIHAHSQDNRLHTFLDSYPVLPKHQKINKHQPRQPLIKIIQPIGIQPLSCGVHPRERPKVLSHIAVFHHPFATQTDEQGRFRFEKIPAGQLEIEAWTPEKGSSTTLLLRAQTVTTLRLQIQIEN